MSTTDKAPAHALLIDGKDVPTSAPRTVRPVRCGSDEHLAMGSEMPHGEVKGSDFGKDMSMYALEEYTAVKHVVFGLTGAPRKEWYDAVSTPE